MFSFFKKKPKDTPAPPQEVATQPEGQEPPATPAAPAQESPVPVEQKSSWLNLFRKESPSVPVHPAAPVEPAASTVPVEPPIAEPPVAEPEAAAEPEGEIVPPPPPPPEQKRSWMQRLKAGLSKTSSNLTTLFVGARIDDELYEELESALLVSDAGVEATQFILDALKKKVKTEKLTEAEQVKTALRTLLIDMLTPLQKPFVLGRHQPLVMMIAGVNGAGKTTTIGKLAKHLQAHQQSVLLAAGDTFRAAAREQLAIWGERNNVTVIAQESGDPAAVAFDAVQSAKARDVNVVMIDTAGRLPTQLHLMEELKKVKRVIAKGLAGAPHEVLLVIDGNTGQNALAQVKAFDDALQLTGLVITKLDGTAKGGVLAAIAKTRPVPVYFIGVGEKIEDLQPFNAEEFVDALLS
ncbi:MAG TPA: signal recognition particle-docking protein FtsY [Noviherbaspirillum sp.]|uniref:signal recognition particle-docking protein FtsY n=1 Tax=Noviherbaspirillum sp. TaxID=1926288 RepID=UPI002B46634B|nr:signal recognition particle-docking protein FtsY [Noviherbaspirillum sp.]HJV87958.1 signal recognition particle-docking protein FtsY [Noviherbaspirillum sp.]